MRKTRAGVGALSCLSFGVLATLAACVGDDPDAVGNSSSSGNATSSGDGGPGANSSGAPGTSSGQPGNSSSSGGPPGCSASCAGGNVVCGGVTTATCALGCSDLPAHCNTFDPAGELTASTAFDATNLTDFTLDFNTMTLDLGTGQITAAGDGVDAGPVVVRAANTNPAANEVHEGVAFLRNGGGVILRAANLQVQGDARGKLTGTGGLPLRLVAIHTLRVQGILDLPCGATLGGFAGNNAATANGAEVDVTTGRVGIDSDVVTTAGGGGGGHGGIGGIGGAGSATSTAGSGGQAASSLLQLEPLTGGGGGARGALGTGGFAGPSGAGGGGGGAALHLIAGDAVILGAESEAAAGVNVGGCGGGARTRNKIGFVSGAAGGAGAGGVILVEAPVVRGGINAGLAANGGGGGGGGSAGEAGRLGVAPATGGTRSSSNSSCLGHGGAGAAANQPAGLGGSPGIGNCYDGVTNTTDTNRYGGGGGGATGRIVIRSAEGQYSKDPSFFTSPSTVGFAQATLAPIP